MSGTRSPRASCSRSRARSSGPSGFLPTAPSCRNRGAFTRQRSVDVDSAKGRTALRLGCRLPRGRGGHATRVIWPTLCASSSAARPVSNVSNPVGDAIRGSARRSSCWEVGALPRYAYSSWTGVTLRCSAAARPALLGTSWAAMGDYQPAGVGRRRLGSRFESRWGRYSRQRASIVPVGGRHLASVCIR